MAVLSLSVLGCYPEPPMGGNWLAFLEDERPHGREMKTTRELPTLTVTAGVQPRWIQDDSTVGMELASLEITYLITDREGLEN